ncbi:zinc finger CCCH domain-containing protein 13-like [Saccostrea echinata]|uniref:zinc finger CCCH domain-containing protein 13-like n=1 Tax=Saccostrea echinata TaxID=191078 RepID=UPI002A82C66F|nr:zinc finger CCCH domain-containing protein 13-like [Saccostrea echinata]
MNLLSPDKRKVQSAVEDNEEDINPKRGRGRPRKMDKPEKIKVPGRGSWCPPRIDSPEKLANVMSESDEINKEKKSEEVKQNGRGCGCPRTYNTAKSMGLKSPEKEKEESIEEEEGDFKLKRGRGRPPKINREPEKIKVQGRGRGRPPKSTMSNTMSLTSAANASDDEVIPSSRSPSNSHSPSSLLLPTENKLEYSEEEKEEGEKDVNPKRGRGRPPKMNRKPEKIRVPGRGRGRPHKSPDNSTDLLSPMKKNGESEKELEEMDEEDNQLKRSRGRPRRMNKTPDKITVPGRDRGRPPKSEKSNRNRGENETSEGEEPKENGIREDPGEENQTHKNRGRGRPGLVDKVSINLRKSPLYSAANSKESDVEDSSEDSGDSWDSGSEMEDKEDTDWDISQANYIQKPVKKGSRKSPRKVKRGRGRPRTVNKIPISPQRRAMKSIVHQEESDVEDSSEDSSDSWDSGSEKEDKEDTDWEMSDENCVRIKKQKQMKRGTWKSPRDVNKPGKRKRYTSAFSSDDDEGEEDFEPGTTCKITSLSASQKTNLEVKEGESGNGRTSQKSLKRGRGRPPKLHKKIEENVKEEERLNSNGEENLKDRDSEIGSPSPKSLKRGRGRPPKLHKKADLKERERDENMQEKESLNSREEECSKNVDSENKSLSPKSLKRGRGRPPKLHKKTDLTERGNDQNTEEEKRMNSNEEEHSKDGDLENGSPPQKSLKRGREGHEDLLKQIDRSDATEEEENMKEEEKLHSNEKRMYI